MNNQLTILSFAILFLGLVLSFSLILAEDNSTIKNESNTIYLNNSEKITYGKCVVEVAKVRQDCYMEEKNASSECTSKAQLDNNKNASKSCAFNYKENKKNCKTIFKEAKKNCIQIYKPGFWERMKYSFK